jgi:uncharacterized protein YecT (DUF1311 family)
MQSSMRSTTELNYSPQLAQQILGGEQMSSWDRTQEILDVKQRDARWIWFGPHGLEDLQQDWLKNRGKEACKPDFYLIRIVTLLEVFTRRNLADLIDHDKRYTDRAIDFSKQVKIDFALIRDIQGRTITLGDILSHSVPVNSFGQIVGHFETLLGKPVRPILEAAVDRRDTEVMKKASGPIIVDYDAMARSLTRLFEVRHILCHEAPRQSVYVDKEIDEFLDKAIRLAKALHEVLTFERFGLVPLTQTEMNIAANEDLKKTQDKMNALFSEIEARVTAADAKFAGRREGKKEDNWLSCLKDAQEQWLSYRNSHCEFNTYLNRGGTILSLLWASEANRLTQLRIADLESWLKHDSER